MIVGHVEFAVRDSLPVLRNPPILAVFAKHVRRMISPGDTVCIRPSDLDSPSDLDNILGRVLDIEADYQVVSQSLIPVHPDSVIPCPLIKLQ